VLGIALPFGLTVVVMAYAIGPISGCHINPAITISMLVAGKISGKDSVSYIIAQLIGATLGSAVLYAILRGSPGFELGEYGLGANGWGPGYLGNYTTVSAFLTEAIMTFLFLFVIFATTSKLGNSNMAGLAIGLTLVLIHLLSIHITGTSVNPARSFGPAIFAGGKALSQLWLFIVAPLVGGIISALVWKGIFENKE
jgi:aquaporin Z